MLDPTSTTNVGGAGRTGGLTDGGAGLADRDRSDLLGAANAVSPNGVGVAARDLLATDQDGFSTPELVQYAQADNGVRTDAPAATSRDTITFVDKRLGRVTLPRPEDHMRPYDAGHPRYHEYEHIGVLHRGPVDADKMWEAFRRHPAPGGDGQPVSTGDETYVSVAGGIVQGTVTHTVRDSDQTIVNTTKPDHTLHDGQVQRSLIITDQGAFVYTTGRGINSNAVTQAMNSSPVGVNMTWGGINNDVAAEYQRLMAE